MIKVEPEKLTERDLKDYWILTHEEESLNRLTTKEQALDASKSYKIQVDKVTKDDIANLSADDKRIATIYKKMNQWLCYDRSCCEK
ncbi:penicillin-binding protein 2A [Listeria fleischmannii FSL S10-1203]|uniref:Penicillin-binding protein 2A n=1 Tax=Listeria fleischmannii FSL S10-1203 TaxID=1265822 RepID=W7DRY1_9LIST|nr:penicillin-binding protein 2A [Listeria fleischmannii FSL S10-1203]